MGWADLHIQKLKAGQTVSFRPHGNSMSGRIESGQLCWVEPAVKENIKVGDAVLCKVNGKQYLHIIKAINGERVMIGNNKGFNNGWTSFNCVYGKLIKVED